MVAPRRYYTIQEAARILGLSVSTIRRRIADGTLSVFQPGGERTAIRVPLAALEHVTDVKPNEAEHDTAESTSKPKRKGPPPKWQALFDHHDSN